jgi:transposase-like protein
MMSAVEKYAADSVARKCPECDSHTTRIVGKDGESQCHACGHDLQDQTAS